MKIFVLILIFTFSLGELYSQFNIPGIIKRKVEEKVEQKTEEAVEKALEGEDENSEEKIDESSENDKTKTVKPLTLKSYSKFDFIPGEEIIFFEDFSIDAIGDFPARWNTNGTGEVVTLDNMIGKWLKISQEAFYVPEMKYPFPENYTLEFDVIVYIEGLTQEQLVYDRYGWFKTEFTSLMDPTKPVSNDATYNSNFVNSFEFEYGFGGNSRFYINNNIKGESGGITNDNEFNFLGGYFAKPIHISMAINKQRFRVWVNQNKVFDIPRFFPKDLANIIRFSTYGLWDNYNYQILISNIRLAASKQDDRSKLLTEGKIVTNAIKFDVASDKIKPESYATIKSIADVLIKNPEVRIKIIGHTDSDGSAEKNLTLSKQRAESVKKSLIDEFQIDSSRIEAEGKGSMNPIADNASSEGKALNRRVEFIKL